MDSSDSKNWEKRSYDYFEYTKSFKKCSMCKEAIPMKEFSDTSICNNCLQRYHCNQSLLKKFVEWSHTTESYKSISSLGTFYSSQYSAPTIEKMVLSAIINKAERKDLYKALLTITVDAGDQLMLSEVLEELSNLQDDNETKNKKT